MFEKLSLELKEIVASIRMGMDRGSHFGADRPYMYMVRHVLANGQYSENRTDTDTIYTFGSQWRYDARTIPLLTTKKLHTKSIIGELVWFLRGETNVKFLQNNGISIWDEWADADGNLGPVYGSQWRAFGAVEDSMGDFHGGIDQIEQLVQDIVKNPASRRHIVTAWNPREVPNCKLPPCHVMWQIDVNQNTGAMSLMLTQRSLDVFLGAPFNVASYAMLLHIICNEVNRRIGIHKYHPHEFVHSVANTHIYVNHIEPLWKQWQRDSCPNHVELDLHDFQINDPKIENIVLTGYNNYHPAIAGKVAV